MKQIVKLLSLMLLTQFTTLANLSAQGDPAKVGFIRLINLASAGEGNLKFKLDGQNLYASGYKVGQMTGGIGHQEGSMTILATKEGCRDGKRDIKIVAGKTTTYVTYTTPVRDSEGRIIAWEIKITSLKQSSPQKGYAITLVSLCPEKELEVVIKAEGKRVPIVARVASHRIKVVGLGNARGDIGIEHAGKPLVGFSSDDPGNYVVMIYLDAEGKKRAIQYYDPKFMIAG